MDFKELLENYNVYKADIKNKEYQIKKLESKDAGVSSPNVAINADIRSKR